MIASKAHSEATSNILSAIITHTRHWFINSRVGIAHMSVLASRIGWLSIETIAQLWSEEISDPPSVIERALIEWFSQCAHEVVPREHGSGWIDSALEDYWERIMEKGVTKNTPMPRGYLATFCEKGELDNPKFWFPDQENVPLFDWKPNPPGRPTSRALYLNLFDKAVEAGEITADDTLKHVANVLHGISAEVKPRTIERYVGSKFRQLKAGTRTKKQ